MKGKIPVTKRIFAGLAAVILLMGNLTQTVTVRAENPVEQEPVVFYSVNCGGDVLPEGESYGLYNGDAADQAYQADSAAEYHWGYDSSYEYETAVYENQAVRLIKGNDAEPLSYYFELPQGDYCLKVDMPHCAHWGNRVMNIDLQVGEGAKQNLVSDLNTTDDIAENSTKSITADFTVTEEKQLVTVSAVRSNDKAWAPFLGYIKIMEKKELIDKTIAYYVDCGGDALPEGERYGIYNGGSVDQEYQADSAAEYHWGYAGGYEFETISPSNFAGHTVRIIKGDDSAKLNYYFELPQGDYRVKVDIPYCTHDGQRVLNVDLQVGTNEKQNLISNLNTTNDIEVNTVKSLTADFTVTDEKQVVTVSAVRSNDESWAPFLGAIKISKESIRPEDDGLLAALEAAKTIYETGNETERYTAESWQVFETAYEAALQLKDSTDYEAKKSAAEALNGARAGLAKKPDEAGNETIDNSVAYYVDCGSDSISSGKKYGIYNGGAVDQAYQADGAAEYNWGYNSSYTYETDTYAGQKIRLVKGDDAAALSYYFELPKGNYSVDVEIPHCTYWGNRVMNIDLQVGQGAKQSLISNLNTTEDIAANSSKMITADFTVAEEKQLVTVFAVRSSSNAWAPYFGQITIRVRNKLLQALEGAKDIYEAGNTQEYYTKDSWEAFAKAYEEAKALEESTDEDRRSAAADQLADAQKSLKKAKRSVWNYDFEDGIADASLVVNKSGNNISEYTGTADYGEGRNGGKALQTGSYGLRLNKKNLGKEYTVNAWICANGTISNNTALLFLGHHDPQKWAGIAGSGLAGQCKIWTMADGSYTTLSEKISVPRAEWTMITMQSDGRTTMIYENGELAAWSKEITDVLSGVNQDIYLCVNFWDGQVRGLIDDVSVYDECLTQEEVYQLYDSRSEEEILDSEGFVAPEKMTVVSGSQKKIAVTLPKGVKQAKLTFASDDRSVAEVSEDGTVTGIAPGTAVVTTSATIGNTAKSCDTAITVRSADVVAEDGVLYFVDCGNEDTGLTAEDLFGQYNRTPDQKLGADSVTDKTWGWGKIGENDPETGTNKKADEDSKEFTYRVAGASSDFYYEFELPEELYQVEVTIPYFLSGSNTRTFEILASSGADGAVYETVANNINTKQIDGSARTYSAVCAADGENPLRLSFLSDSDAWGPIVSAIRISEVSVQPYVDALQKMIDMAKLYQVKDYSDASYNVLQAAIQNAEEAISSIATAKQARELDDALKAAVRNLEPGVNARIASLKGTIERAKACSQADYTEDSYAKLQEAVEAAEAQLGQIVSVSQAMKLEDAVLKAMDALVKKTPVKPPVDNKPEDNKPEDNKPTDNKPTDNGQDKKPPVSYQVTFDSAGGSKTASQTVVSGQKAAVPKQPTRANYLFKGWYAGNQNYDFNQAVTANLTLKAKWTKVTVGTPKITSAKNSKSKQCVVKIKKVSGAAGYDVVYSTDKKFRKSVKKINSRKNQATIKKLKKGKTYYIKVRAYKYDSKGKKISGKYSTKKKILVKK